MGCACCCVDTSDVEASPIPQPLPDPLTTDEKVDAYVSPPKQGVQWDSKHVPENMFSDYHDESPPQYKSALCMPFPGDQSFDPKVRQSRCSWCTLGF
jgi:hypothetical protein